MTNNTSHSDEGRNPSFRQRLWRRMGSGFRRNDGIGICVFGAIFFFLHAAQAETIIGLAGPMTGPNAVYGAQMLHGAQQAVDDLNLAGASIKLEIVDDQCDNRQAEIVAQELVLKNVNAVVGHFCSNATLAAAKIYELAGIPLIVPSASLPRLAMANLWYVVRLASRDDMQGDFAAARVAADFPTGVVAVLKDGSKASEALANRFTSALGKAPALTVSYKPDAADFEALALQLADAKIDVIYFAGAASDAGHIAAGVQGAALFGSDQLLDDLYLKAAGDAAAGTFVTLASDPQAETAARPIINKLKTAGFDADGAALPTYAAFQLIEVAVKASAAQNGKAVVANLKSGAGFPTVLGELHFDQTGEVQPPRFVWYKAVDGGFRAEK